MAARRRPNARISHATIIACPRLKPIPAASTSNARLRTRRERADRLKKDRKDLFDKYALGPAAFWKSFWRNTRSTARTQFVIPEILEVPPLSEHGNVLEIAGKFGGVDKLREAIAELQTLLYAAA